MCKTESEGTLTRGCDTSCPDEWITSDGTKESAVSNVQTRSSAIEELGHEWASASEDPGKKSLKCARSVSSTKAICVLVVNKQVVWLLD